MPRCADKPRSEQRAFQNNHSRTRRAIKNNLKRVEFFAAFRYLDTFQRENETSFPPRMPTIPRYRGKNGHRRVARKCRVQGQVYPGFRFLVKDPFVVKRDGNVEVNNAFPRFISLPFAGKRRTRSRGDAMETDSAKVRERSIGHESEIESGRLCVLLDRQSNSTDGSCLVD